MAISREERNKRLQVIHVMKRLLKQDDVKPVKHLNEDARENKIVNLDRLEEFLDGKSLPYYKGESLDSARGSIGIDIFFMSNKNTEVDPDDNLLRLVVGNSDYTRVDVLSDTSCKLEKFMGLPSKVKSPDFKSPMEVVRQCDSYEMYNVYSKKALDIVRMRMPSAYHMFTGSNIIKRVDESEGTTLWVTFDKRFHKFIYGYNPDFILETALDEWCLNSSSYESLKDCYCYVLAFLITHEMMHIIHHNTTTTIDMDFAADNDTAEGHEVVNIMRDSFINCKISQVFSGVQGLRGYGAAPTPRLGVGTDITVRAEHNVGFKRFGSAAELGSKITDVITGIVKKEGSSSVHYVYGPKNRDISKFEGADVFVRVNVPADADELRSNSAIFQKVTNDIIKVITDGKVYNYAKKLTTEEKEAEKEILPIGTLVRVKGSSKICSVGGYDETSKKYDLTENEMSSVNRTYDNKTGGIKCTPVYTPTGKNYGKLRRRDIVPFRPDDNSWIEANEAKEKKKKLSQEDLEKLNQQGNGSPPAQDMGQENAPQVFSVGDIVWVKATRKFGKIVSINNGKFKLEEMEEVGVRVLDDSDYHNTSGEGV